MNREDVERLLAAVAAGEVAAEDAAERLAQLAVADLDFARVDLHRELRNGVAEAIFGEGKRDEDLLAIARRLEAAHGRFLATRVDPARAPALLAALPGARYHDRARILALGSVPARDGRDGGPVAVLAAGTSDLPVAEEAAVTLEWLGIRAERHYDVGVAGVHRLLSRLPAVRAARVVVAVAGMDGALPTVVAGLVATPVIAVPTSVGYGASFHGLAPLLTMLNACAPGVAVVNIDNGFGAAVVARRVLGEA